VLFEPREHVALITLNRPEARNALSPEVVVRLAGAWERVRDDESIRAAVVTGAGDRSFCAGADLARLIPLITGARQPEDDWDHALMKDPALSDRALLRDFDPVKPVIAAVNGFAIAGGMEMLQGTDLRVASENARFGLQEVKWGLFPMSGSTVRLPRQIPYAAAMEILLTGDLIDARRAYELGLVNRVVPQAEVLAPLAAVLGFPRRRRSSASSRSVVRCSRRKTLARGREPSWRSASPASRGAKRPDRARRRGLETWCRDWEFMSWAAAARLGAADSFSPPPPRLAPAPSRPPS
jgi:enoyl-CoA hydratase